MPTEPVGRLALLQVNQAKPLKDLYKGGHDPKVMQELQFLISPVSQTGPFCDAIESFAQQFLDA